MLSTRRLLKLALALMATLGFLSAQPVLANCDAAQESCSSSCGSLATSGFIVGMAGALQQNNNAYQTGQRNMQNAQACYSRCQAQFQACSRQEEEARQRTGAQNRAQQQQLETQRQQRQRQQLAQAEREALRQRVNQVVSPPRATHRQNQGRKPAAARSANARDRQQPGCGKAHLRTGAEGIGSGPASTGSARRTQATRTDRTARTWHAPTCCIRKDARHLRAPGGF